MRAPALFYGAAVAALLILGGEPIRGEPSHDCRVRIERDTAELDRSVAHDGEHSRAALKARATLNRTRAWCWSHHRGWWDAHDRRWHTEHW